MDSKGAHLTSKPSFKEPSIEGSASHCVSAKTSIHARAWFLFWHEFLKDLEIKL